MKTWESVEKVIGSLESNELQLGFGDKVRISRAYSKMIKYFLRESLAIILQTSPKLTPRKLIDSSSNGMLSHGILDYSKRLDPMERPHTPSN